MNIAQRIKELRTSQGISQAELAKRLGLTAGAIGMYESGTRKPKYEILELIADYFNVDMNYLLGNENESSAILDETQIAIQKAFDARPEMRALFSVTKDCTKEQVEGFTRMIEAFLDKNED